MVTNAKDDITHRWTVVMLMAPRCTGRGSPGTIRACVA